MIVVVNGRERTFGAGPDITGLLKAEGYEGKLVAVAVNGAFVPRAAYEKITLNDGDEIDIVAPMQGG